MMEIIITDNQEAFEMAIEGGALLAIFTEDRGRSYEYYYKGDRFDGLLPNYYRAILSELSV